MRPHARAFLLFVAVSLLLPACGARLTAQQRDAALRQDGGAGTGAVSGSSGDLAGTGTTAAGPGRSGAAGTLLGGHSTTASVGGVATAGPGAAKAAGPGASSACAAGTGGATDVGVTKDKLNVANIADVSGPVPGLFESAQQATKAFAAYWNATYGGVCGRQLVVQSYDSGTDSGTYRTKMLEACKSAFASVGSMSAFDDGGASVEDGCGIPDFSAASVTPAHQSTKVTHAAESTKVGIVSSTVPMYIAQKFPQAVSKAAFLYINAGASAPNATTDIQAYEKYGHGWHFIYKQPVDISTFNYTPYVQKMKQQGVRFVQWLGAYQQAVRLAQAMKEQDFHPDMFLLDPTGYNADYVAQGGDAVDGTYVYMDLSLFELAQRNPETQLYLQWLQRTTPNATPSYFGAFAWSAARLFVTMVQKVGPDLTRKKVLAAVANVHDWTGNGLTSPQDVGAGITSKCFSFIQLRGGKWQQAFPSQGFSCNPLVNVNG